MGRRKRDSKEMDEFRKHLKEFREGLELNRKELSNLLGMSASSVRNIEKGYKKPGYNFLKALNEKYPEIDLLEWFGFKVVR